MAASLVNATRREQLDFATRYAAGVATAHGQDPYSPQVLNPIERRLTGLNFRYPFRDPPPVAWAFRAVAVVPYNAAAYLWLVALLIAAVTCSWFTLRLLGIRAGPGTMAVLVAGMAVGFAPLRDSLTRFQVDPLPGALSLMALYYARHSGAGLLQALATLKPQDTLLSSFGGVVRGGKRFLLALLGGWAVLFAATAAWPSGPSWRAWIHAVHAADRTTHVAEAAAIVFVVLVGAGLAWSRSRRLADPGLAAFAVGATVTSVVGQLFFLNSQSRLLMLVPFAILVRPSVGRPVAQVAVGAALGVYVSSGLFAVTWHSGLGHAALPVAVAAAFALATVVAYPELRFLAWTALVVNLVVTAPPLSPRVHEWLGSSAALLVLGLLCGISPLEQGEAAQEPLVRPTVG